MTYVVTRTCLGTKDRSCCEVCPVDCFYDIKDKALNDQYDVEAKDNDYGLLVIHPDECINCGACETECPVEAIFEDSSMPDDEGGVDWLKVNEELTVDLSENELDDKRCTSR